MKQYMLAAAEAIVCSGLVLASVFHISCKVTDEGIQILAGDYDSPVLESYKVTSGTEVSMRFSESVRVDSMEVYEAESNSDQNVVDSFRYEEGQKQVLCALSEKMITGAQYMLYGEIKDMAHNTLSFSLPFVGFNDHRAYIVLNEIQDGKTTTGNLKYEFVEIYVLESGSMAGLALYSANDGEARMYRFPSIEVKKGEYITVHMRIDEDCKPLDETGDNLAAASGYATSSARDLWNDNEKACFGASADVIAIIDVNSNDMLDAFLYSKSEKDSWAKPEVRAQAERAFKAGIWIDGSAVTEAFQVTKKSSPFIFARQNIQYSGAAYSVSASDWTMVTPSHATPGQANSQ